LGLDFLQQLQRYQLASVPWENLSKFYNPRLSPVSALLGQDDVFDKIVGAGANGRLDGRGGRGGGCLENNTLFGTVLRSLGYDIFSTAGRVHIGGGNYSGW
jgi:arylamine N-acetyltransferase